MASISIWIFDNKAKAKAHANEEERKGRRTIGPTQLGSVDVTSRSGSSSTDEFFREFSGKWGVVVVG